MLLDMLQLYKEHHFEGIAMGDKSWFRHSTYADSMFAPSAEEVVQRRKQNISARKIMITFCRICWTVGAEFPTKRDQVQSKLFH
jgi:hypothetical protein